MKSGRLNRRLKVMAAAMAVGLASVGLSACASTTNPLACTTLTSVGKNLAGTVTTNTAPGAAVLTVANFQTARLSSSKVANANGIATAAFDLRKATTTNRIDVSVLAVKGNASGVCSTKFVKTSGTSENNQPGTGPKPALKAGVTAAWAENTPAIGDELPYDPDNPNLSCFNFDSTFNDQCGSVALTTLISGFSGFGGIAACPASDPTQCSSPDPNAANIDTSNATFGWTMTCPGQQPKSNSAAAKVHPDRGLSKNWVFPRTRVSADAAKLQVTADLPQAFVDDIASCDKPSTLNALSLYGISQHLDPGKTKYPNFTFTSGANFSLSPAS